MDFEIQLVAKNGKKVNCEYPIKPSPFIGR